MVAQRRDPHSYGNERSRAMRGIRDRFRRLAKSLWLRPASPDERRLRTLRLPRGPVLKPAFAPIPVAIDEARRLRSPITIVDPARSRASV